MKDFHKTESESEIQSELRKLKKRNRILVILALLFFLVAVFFFIENSRIRNQENSVIIALNQGQLSSLSVITSKNELIYSFVSRNLLEEPVRFKPFFDKIKLAQKNSDDLVNFITNLRTKLIAYTEFGIYNKSESADKWSIADTISLRNVGSKNDYNKPMEILIGKSGDDSKGEGIILKKKLEEYKYIIERKK